MENQIQFLLRKIQYYYPIGIPSLQDGYPGYNEIGNIVEMKIKDIQDNENTPWVKYITEIKQKHENSIVFDFSYLQFPNYLAKIELDHQTNSKVQIHTYLIVCLSLLVPFYTVFSLTEYKLGGYQVTDRVRFKLISIISTPPVSETLVSDVCKGIANHFKKYEKIDYRLLFSKNVSGGVPYGLGKDHNADFTIYDFLFSNSLIGLDYYVY